MKKLILKGYLKQSTSRLNPSVTVVLSFFVLILVGTVLLKLPIATTETISWLNTLFTATSAVTVTGLIVVDTGTAFTLFGQTVIMFLMQIGGLGLMTAAVFIFFIFKRKISMQQRNLIKESLNQDSSGGIIRLVRYLFFFSFSIELIGFILLSIKWIPEFGLSKGAFYSLFHTVAAFNNAGFSLWSDNLSSYVGDPIVNLTITSMFILGGIGFTVLLDVWNKKKFKTLTLHSKVMIVGTLVINISAVISIFILEYSNPQTLGSLSFEDKMWSAYFQGLTPRTAGFNSIDITALTLPSMLLTVLLMFIGAGSASTGSGIKLSTFIILLLTTITFLKGGEEVSLFGRRLKNSAVLRALTLTLISFLLVFVAIFILAVTENESFIAIVFEVVSAFGTVGLSTGLTTELSTIGRFVIMVVMFIGRIGPITIASILLTRKKTSLIRYPQEDIFVG
ncbi:TrkH family potassium uptake protein [Carnobacterium inhibens]|uniref:Ktr system potassium transporter B n=1 Tax=Carnobacterium inhibens TaxID=147709 RepID=A0ABR7TDT2_9LACT|nr:TrkH family potassium uptake protein [Carnobacterium inhibens]MBC9826145.1 Ktr system potassium transporter B [Carnobacterium inhibens]